MDIRILLYVNIKIIGVVVYYIILYYIILYRCSSMVPGE